MGSTYQVVPVTALDYRRLSERKLPRFLFDYIDGGANDELTLAANVRDLQNIRIKQKVLRDVSAVSTAAHLMGSSCAMPVALAPVGFAGMFSRRGEAMAVRVANQKDIPFTLSTVGICPVEEVRAQVEHVALAVKRGSAVSDLRRHYFSGDRGAGRRQGRRQALEEEEEEQQQQQEGRAAP